MDGVFEITSARDRISVEKDTRNQDSNPSSAEDLRYLSFKGQLLAIAAAWLVLLLLIVLDIQESLYPLAFLRLLLGLSFVLFFPGFLLQAAIFASRDDLDGIERVALSIGLSIALIPLLALVLDRLPWGIFLWPIVVGESVVMLLAGGVAYYRCRRLPPEARWYLTLPVSPVGVFLGLDRMTRWILGIAGVAALTGIAIMIVTLVRPNPTSFFTEFYILGKEGLAEDYPREAMVGEPLWVTVGVVNREREDRTYRVEVWAVDPWTDGKQELVYQEGPIHLARNQGREWPISWRMPWAGDDQVVRFLLYTEGDSKPYRSLRLWINVKAPTPTPTPTSTSIPTPIVPTPTSTLTPALTPTPTLSPTPTSPSTPSPTATSTPTPTPSPLPRPPYTGWTVAHIVQPGEYLALIANQYGVSYLDIAAYNQIDDPKLIHAGQVLIIPLPSIEAAERAAPPLLGAAETITETLSYPVFPPQLLSPDDGQEVTSPVQLAWERTQSLGDEQCFVLILWRGGQSGPGRIFLTQESTYTLDLTDFPADTYRWSVRVGQCGEEEGVPVIERFLSSEAAPRSFRYLTER